MPPTIEVPAWFRLAEKCLTGSLADFIEGHRAAGLSWDRISRQLAADTAGEVDVTGVTLAVWATRLGLKTERATA